MIFTIFFSFLSDILSSGIWLEAALLIDSLLSVMKSDQHGEGHTAFLARSGKVTCPVAVTERLVKLLPQSSSAFPYVRRIMKAKSKEHFHSSLGVSMTTLRVEFKKHIKAIVREVSKYGTHSMKSGAAPNPACRKIARVLLDIHAGWRRESANQFSCFCCSFFIILFYIFQYSLAIVYSELDFRFCRLCNF